MIGTSTGIRRDEQCGTICSATAGFITETFTTTGTYTVTADGVLTMTLPEDDGGSNFIISGTVSKDGSVAVLRVPPEAENGNAEMLFVIAVKQ